MLFRRWKTNGVKIGDKIESQNEIVKFCEFSLITVIKTLKDLEAEGIIRRQVGKGSFLVKTPWTEAHHRIGFFYNRDIVGGGIFNNDFYTKLVVALRKGRGLGWPRVHPRQLYAQEHADASVGRARRGGADRHHQATPDRPARRDVEPGGDHRPGARGPALPRLPHRLRTGFPGDVQAATTASSTSISTSTPPLPRASRPRASPRSRRPAPQARRQQDAAR